MSFRPTYLYIKQHNITKLKYLGKTVRNPLTYKGSGSYWQRHLKVHGDDVTTVWYELFTDEDLCEEFALFLSKEFNIVQSKSWANLKDENGLDGLWPDRTGRKTTDAAKQKISDALTGRKLSEEHKRKQSIAASKRVYTQEEKDAYSRANTGRKHTEKAKENMKKAAASRQTNYTQCPHCNKVGVNYSMTRHHFDNCKLKDIE